MSLMYEVNTINAAMIKAAEICRQDMPEGEKVNAVLACFAGMKPVEAEPVVHARWERGRRNSFYRCTCCKNIVRMHGLAEFLWMLYCPHCGACMDAREDAACE